MNKIITHPTAYPLQAKFQNTDVKNNKEFGKDAVARELDCVKLQALFDIEYQQFMTDTSYEIAKSTQRLSELKAFVYGKPSSE
jgi:hypothetical protein